MLMMDINRVVQLAAFDRSPQEMVETSRDVTAIFATATVLVVFFLFRDFAGNTVALLTALAIALSPIMVVHAHYFKEDSYFVFALFLALLSYLRFVREQNAVRVWSLGIATGLAVAAKYAGVLLILFYLLQPMIVRIEPRRTYYRNILACCAIAFMVFLAADYSLFENFQVLERSLAYETTNVLTGHPAGGARISISPWDFWFAFHLLHSIVPGVGIAMLSAALISIAALLSGRLKASRDEVLLFNFAWLFYLAIEISPSKPFPDFMRYAMPIVPILLYLSVKGAVFLGQILAPSRFAAGLLLCLGLIAWSGYDTAMLVTHLKNESRLALNGILQSLDGNAAMEGHRLPSGTVFSVTDIPIQRLLQENVRYVVVQNFGYDGFASRLPHQDPRVYVRQQHFDALFSCQYREIPPTYESFAFSNPTLRIIDLQTCPGSEKAE